MSASSIQGTALPLHELVARLPPRHRMFIQSVDAQVAKVEAFYSAQESAMHARTRNIREQGQELALHHNLWHVRISNCRGDE
jgi:hypothetical protein